MFYGLATNKVRVPGYRFTHTLCDIETLNRRAQDEAFFDVTAISFHAYPYLQENYTLMGCGGSVGEGYGPMVVSRKPLTPEDLGRIKIAVPGTLTTAYLALKIFNPEIETETVPFDQIIPAILAGNYDAGLIIHEGQLTYSTSGLYKVIDLGVWWRETTGLVLPLGGNAIRRSLGAEAHKIISKALRDSIQHALDHREAGPRIRHAVCPRPGHRAGQPLREHVRERAHPRLRRRRPRGHPQAARPGPRARHHPHRAAGGFRRLNASSQAREILGAEMWRNLHITFGPTSLGRTVIPIASQFPRAISEDFLISADAS